MQKRTKEKKASHDVEEDTEMEERKKEGSGGTATKGWLCFRAEGKNVTEEENRSFWVF